MSRFKILVFIIAVGIAGSTLAAAYWYSTRVLGKDDRLANQIHQMQKRKSDLPDPGIKRFEKAVELLKADDFDAARDALYDLLRVFPQSKRAAEAKRIVGEMNMDTLFSVEKNPLKKDYIVQPGDSVGLIARKRQTTIECLMRANGLVSVNLQPGDHLFIFPLDFELVVDLSAKTLTLLRNGALFKEYVALDVKLPTNIRMPAPVPGAKYPSGAELTVNDKAAWVSGRRLLSTDAQFMNADKWLMANKPGFNIRSLPQAKPVDAAVQTVMPPAPKVKPKAKGKKNDAVDFSGVVAEADNDPVDGTAGVPETGVFLPREDTEELYTIIRTGTKLTVVR